MPSDVNNTLNSILKSVWLEAFKHEEVLTIFISVLFLTKYSLQSLKGSYRMSKGAATAFAPVGSPSCIWSPSIKSAT